MDYILGAALGGLISFAYSIPAIILELIERGKSTLAPPVITVKTIFGYPIKKQEAFSVGLLLHLVIGMLFGSVYVLFVERGWLFVTHHAYKFDSFLVYGFLSWIFVNLTIYPALQMGLFGRREGKGIWLETLVSHLLLGVTMAGIVFWFQPFYFSVIR
ncbi:MAG: hypothetical protein NTX72_05980 [Candidatus Uhrbacteria bacterium]|nr:hypothetical protein [Candidatus Uhrbacteria bacterium]